VGWCDVCDNIASESLSKQREPALAHSYRDNIEESSLASCRIVALPLEHPEQEQDIVWIGFVPFQGGILLSNVLLAR